MSYSQIKQLNTSHAIFTDRTT